TILGGVPALSNAICVTCKNFRRMALCCRSRQHRKSSATTTTAARPPGPNPWSYKSGSMAATARDRRRAPRFPRVGLRRDELAPKLAHDEFGRLQLRQRMYLDRAYVERGSKRKARASWLLSGVRP